MIALFKAFDQMHSLQQNVTLAWDKGSQSLDFAMSLHPSNLRSWWMALQRLGAGKFVSPTFFLKFWITFRCEELGFPISGVCLSVFWNCGRFP